MATQYGGISQQEIQQAAQLPSADMQFAALNAIAEQAKLDNAQRANLFKQAGTRDYNQVSQLESLINAAVNAGTAGLTDLPINPNQQVSNITGSFAGSVGLPWAVAGGVSLIPGGQVVAPFIPGIMGFGQGILESLDESQDRGESFNIGSGLLRGVQGAALNYLPITQGAKGAQLAKEILRNMAIAGASEAVVSPTSELMTRGEINPARVARDIASQVGGQLGGDSFEAVRNLRGLNPRPDIMNAARSVRNTFQPQAQTQVTGRIVGQNEAMGFEQAIAQRQEQFQNNMNQLNQMALINQNQALKLAKNAMQQANFQAARSQGSQQEVIFRQEARAYDNFINSLKQVDKGKRDVGKLQTYRENVQGFEAQGNTQQLKALYRAGRKGTVDGVTPEAKAEAAALAQDAGDALRRLGIEPEAPGKVQQPKPQVSPEEKAALKAIDRVETTEAEYRNLVGDNDEKLMRGGVREKDIRRINEAARKQEVDPKSPEWLREYASALRQKTDQDLEIIRQQTEAKARAERAQAEIAKAKERQAVRESKPERPVGLKALRQDIQQRSREAAKAEAPAKPQGPSPDERANKLLTDDAKRLASVVGEGRARLEDGTAKTSDISPIRNRASKIETDPNMPQAVRDKAAMVRKAADVALERLRKRSEGIRKEAQAKAKAERKAENDAKAREKLKNRFTPYQQNLQKVHKGMTETPAAIKRKLDDAAGTNQVYEIQYYAEKASGGAATNKDFLTRFVTIEDTGTDAQGRRFYVTVDQQNGDSQSRKLFDGVDDSRIVSAEPTNKKPAFALTEKGLVVNRKTGEVVEFDAGNRMATSSMQKALQKAQSSVAVAKRLQATADVVDKMTSGGKEYKKVKEAMEKQSPAARKDIYKDNTGDDC